MMALGRGIRLFPRRLISRAFSSSTDSAGSLPIFDRPYKRKQRDRAAWLMDSKDPLLETVTDTLLDRLKDCKRTFPTALNLGGAVESVRKSLTGHDDIERLVTMDMSHDMVKRCIRGAANEENDCKSSSKQEHLFVVGDEEFLPFKEGSFDLIVSCLGLHWVNDLAGAMIQCRMALKPDGLFLAAMLGGETLRELRIACTTSQLEREGGISPRLSPLARVQDAGNLLTRAGLALTTVDVDQYTVQYPSAIELIEHLRSMGECNAVSQRNQVLKRETALAAASVYESMFKTESGTIPATFQVIYMAGWSPHSSQPKSKGRGSATVSFEDLQEVFAPEDANKK